MTSDQSPHRLCFAGCRHSRCLSCRVSHLAERLDVAPTTVKSWRRAGLLVAHRYDDKGGYLFEPPGADAPVKFQHQGKTRGRRSAA
ncbi:MerR family transcriptional regulator [Paraburkholderia sp. GAS448]|uniref:MerR family transcriptional regulator n=1 Tax=Paraburkholderia sp. GAS448 TaxID=3035136 RepID=UPI003D22479B